MSENSSLARESAADLVNHSAELISLLADLWAYLEGQSPILTSGGLRNHDLRRRLYELSVCPPNSVNTAPVRKHQRREEMSDKADLHMASGDAKRAYYKAMEEISLCDSLEEMTLWVEAWLQPKNAHFWSPEQYDAARDGAQRARAIISKVKPSQRDDK